MKLIDHNKNIYEILLTKNGNDFQIKQASSGERELINFLFGIFAFIINQGLIIIDEPELHLHPKWQLILVDFFKDLAHTMNNQFILSTHSPVFINSNTISNVLRIYKDENNSSKLVKIQKNDLNTKDLIHMINSYNNEKMFFADKVVLVEGIHDRLIFEKLIEFYSENGSEVIEVLEVHGKHSLQKYRDFLENIKVKNFIIADLDYLSTIGNISIKNLFGISYRKIDREVINKKSSKGGKGLSEELENAINSDDKAKLMEIWEYIKSRNIKIKEILTDNEKKIVNDFIDSKKPDNIFVLKKGELEEYLPEGYKSKDSEKVINLTKDENFSNWWNTVKNGEKGNEICSIVLNILNT